LYGAVIRELTGTRQDYAVTTDAEAPLHKVVFEIYVTLSLKRIWTTTEVITEPPVLGTVQVISTFVPLIDVTGAGGVPGLVAAIIANYCEFVLKPIAL